MRQMLMLMSDCIKDMHCIVNIAFCTLTLDFRLSLFLCILNTYIVRNLSGRYLTIFLMNYFRNLSTIQFFELYILFYSMP